jgi:hypothetical protein
MRQIVLNGMIAAWQPISLRLRRLVRSGLREPGQIDLRAVAQKLEAAGAQAPNVEAQFR